MRYEPTLQELRDIAGMVARQRVQYFLTRTLESEEIWGLADPEGWVMQETDGKTILPLWPYRQLALDCADAADLRPHATSLDHFVEHVLPELVAQEIQVELLPPPRQSGALLAAAELREMYRSLMESGEYFLEA